MTTPVRIATDRSLAYLEGDIVRVRPSAREESRLAILSFLDMMATATGRETFYNSKAEQEKMEAAAHEAVFKVNRGLYGAMLTLPAVSDRSVQAGLARLLDNPRAGDDPSFLTWDEEGRLVALLADRIPPQRLFKMFCQFAEKRINNKRTRNLILRTILGAGRKLPLWVVKYRSKVRTALRHALGAGVANGVAAMAAARDPVSSGSARMAQYVAKYIPAGENRDEVYQCVAYALGREREGGWTVPILAATRSARENLEAGSILPVEVLEGIRSLHHKETPHAKVLEIAKAAGTMTEVQKMQGQRAAAKAGVELSFDPAQADLTRLYVLALETGMTPAVRGAIAEKASRLGQAFPVRYAKVGIVLDASESMAGTAEQKWRPLAVGLAMRDVLAASATNGAFVKTAGGVAVDGAEGFVKPSGATSLAAAVVEALRERPDALYVITDGYENAPAGRVDEVLRMARSIGVSTPVYQVTPVSGAEAAGIRRLSDEVAPMPVARPEAIGLGLVRAALTADVETGIAGLLAAARPQLQLAAAQAKGRR
jgi:hypothetical protein